MRDELQPGERPADDTPRGDAESGFTPDEASPDLTGATLEDVEGPAGRRKRRPRRRKNGRPDAEGEGDSLADDATEATLPTLSVSESAESAEALLLRMADREVRDTGEPIPLLRRELTAPLGPEEAAVVLVPEAFEETAPADLAAEARTIIPEITPELRARFLDDGDRSTAQPAPRHRPAGPKPPAPAAPPATPPAPARAAPALILVAEALLEEPPTELVEEEDAALEAFEDADARGRRRRRRGRDRDRDRDRDRRGPDEAVAPTALAPTVAPTTPTRVEDATERDRDRRERERDRDRDRERDRERDRDREPRAAEPKTEREYKEILINVEERETRIAVLENGRLVELHVEREERVVGSIYKGRVSNVLQGMDAAFVDIGLERNAFLYVGDILYEDLTRTGADGEPSRRTSRDIKIKDVAKPGQEILVQVVKGPHGTKGARVSTKISIPGRYLVLMPDGDHMGVSRKISDIQERDRLRRIAAQLQPKGFGLIVRTEAEGHTEQELRQDLDYLVNSWQQVQDRTKRMHAPASIHKDLGIVLKTIRDLFGADVDKLVIDDQEEYEKIVEALQQLAPDLVDRVYRYEEPEPILVKYHVEEEIERLLRRKVWLRNGAYLLLDTTEALTTIDVNTGKFVGTSSLAETILKTNLDAVDEIARQLRLRDIGGMIVLDFIDMASARDRQLVMKALENAFRKDRTRTKVAHISPLGLVEMTRKRTAESVTDVMTQSCPYCQGRGRVWSAETIAIQIEREIRRRCATEEIDALLIYTSPDVAAWLIGPEGESIEQLERRVRRPIYIRARHDFHVEKYEILPSDMMELERQLRPLHGGQVVECSVVKMDLIAPPRSAAWFEGYFVDLANGVRFQGQNVRVRLTDVRRSFAFGEPVAPSTAVDRSEPI